MNTTIGKWILFKLHTIYNVNKYFLTLDLVPSQLTGARLCFLISVERWKHVRVGGRPLWTSRDFIPGWLLQGDFL